MRKDKTPEKTPEHAEAVAEAERLEAERAETDRLAAEAAAQEAEAQRRAEVVLESYEVDGVRYDLCVPGRLLEQLDDPGVPDAAVAYSPLIRATRLPTE